MVACQFQKIGLFLDQDGFESSLKHMANPVVSPVARLGKDSVELAHAFVQIGIRSLNEQVVVVVHQAPCVAHKLNCSTTCVRVSRKPRRSTSSSKLSSHRSPRAVT
jgi:hypothetical protein